MKCEQFGSLIRGIDKDLARGIEDACLKPETSIGIEENVASGSYVGTIAFA